MERGHRVASSRVIWGKGRLLRWGTSKENYSACDGYQKLQAFSNEVSDNEIPTPRGERDIWVLVRKHHQKVPRLKYVRLKYVRLNWRGKRWANKPPSLASTLTTLPLAHPAPATLASGCSLSPRPFPAFPLPAMPFRTPAEPIPLPPAGLYSNSTFSGRPLYLQLQPNLNITFCIYHDILFSVFMVCLSLLDNLQEKRYCLLFSAGFSAPKSA